MIQINIIGRATRAAIAALFTLSFASVACANTFASRPARDPMQWTSVKCVSCAEAGVEVSVRNSLDAKGKSGRHMVAKVRNLNAHAVALVLEIVPEQPRPMDESLISHKWHMMLHPAGGAQDSSLLMLLASDVQAVAVHGVEKY